MVSLSKSSAFGQNSIFGEVKITLAYPQKLSRGYDVDNVKNNAK